ACGRPARDAGVARLHELHDLGFLQLAALLSRSVGARRRVGRRGDQRAGWVEPHRGQRARRAALARRAHADRGAHALDRGPGGAGGGLRPAHKLLHGRGAVPAVRRGHRSRAPHEAGLSVRLVVALPALLRAVLLLLLVLVHVTPVLPQIPTVAPRVAHVVAPIAGVVPQIARVAPRVRGITTLHVLPHVPAILPDVPGVV